MVIFLNPPFLSSRLWQAFAFAGSDVAAGRRIRRRIGWDGPARSPGRHPGNSSLHPDAISPFSSLSETLGHYLIITWALLGHYLQK
jgi:hypothetical protein